jgi:hypothetical protein
MLRPGHFGGHCDLLAHLRRRGELRPWLTLHSPRAGEQERHHPRPRRGVSATQILLHLAVTQFLCLPA